MVQQNPERWREILSASGLTALQLQALKYCWPLHAREKQLPPDGNWWVWLNMSGRGAGKTRSGSEWIRMRRQQGAQRIALVAETAGDVRDVIVEGESGILAVSPPWDRPLYEPSKRRLTWAPTEQIPWETIATTYSGDKPGQLRGPQFDSAWLDEFAKYKCAEQVFPILDPAVRLGIDPRIYVSTTPVPSKAMRELVKDPDTITTNESTFANSRNLPDKTLHRLRTRHEGSRMGRQELYGELLEDIEGALWNQNLIQQHRGRLMRTEHAKARPPLSEAGEQWFIFDYGRQLFRPVPDFIRIAVGVDPAVTSGPGADDTGIIVAALGTDDHVYILADQTCHLPPAGWAKQAVTAYHEWQADIIIGERNNGGELVEQNIRMMDPSVPFEDVTASRSKRTRAEPVSTLYEQGRVHHLGGFPKLEDQMCTWVPGQPSPDRVDALVWALWPLGVDHTGGSGILIPGSKR